MRENALAVRGSTEAGCGQCRQNDCCHFVLLDPIRPKPGENTPLAGNDCQESIKGGFCSRRDAIRMNMRNAVSLKKTRSRPAARSAWRPIMVSTLVDPSRIRFSSYSFLRLFLIRRKAPPQ